MLSKKRKTIKSSVWLNIGGNLGDLSMLRFFLKNDFYFALISTKMKKGGFILNNYFNVHYLSKYAPGYARVVRSFLALRLR